MMSSMALTSESGSLPQADHLLVTRQLTRHWILYPYKTVFKGEVIRQERKKESLYQSHFLDADIKIPSS